MSNIAANRHVLDGAGSSRNGQVTLNVFVKRRERTFLFFGEPRAARVPHFAHQAYTILSIDSVVK
jgi:hypothetical protein